MTSDGILKVVEENPIRGTVEKVYALSFDFNVNIEKIVAENDGKLYMQAVTQYMLRILREFQEYTVRDDMNIALDGSGFSVVPVYATLEELLANINYLCPSYHPTPARSPSSKGEATRRPADNAYVTNLAILRDFAF